MRDDDAYSRLSGLDERCGGHARQLRLGRFVLRLDGLDASLAGTLEERWGPFLLPAQTERPTAELLVVEAGERTWLLESEGGDPLYRLEAQGPPERRVVASRQFALCAETSGPGRFRLGLAHGPEPRGRLIENAVRFIAANLALDHGGFAMHAAGVLHAGKAFVYAGPSRSGKTTAVAASAPARSLGDDFALVIQEAGRFLAAALPFDGAERIPPDATQGLFPVGAIWRLYRAGELRVERPSPRVAAASLLSCAAFPWVYPERAGELVEHVRRFISDGCFAHLHFDRDCDLYARLLGGADPAS